jgi:phage shock protein PspC (stress-responsive transcriptional regulator)
LDENNQKPSDWKNVVATALRLLTFRSTREELRNLGTRHLVFGLVCTWLAGVGRYWDNERANLLQHLGVGSVVYVFALSLLLWLIVWPLRPKNWSYIHVCTFVSLVSPPAILYAIPVERVFSLQSAVDINVWFLAVVAAWRVALLFFYLARHAQLGWLKVIVASLLPLMLIVVALTLLNLERAVFSIMGGIAERTGNDGAYAVLLMLTILSFALFIPTLLCYIFLATRAAATPDARSDYSIVAAKTEDDRN